MGVAYFCFIIAASAGLGGIGLGIWMGIAHDFTLAPVHAHINLLGWVTLSLYGLYHRGVARTDSRFAWAQVGSAALGFLMLTGGMTLLIGAQVEAFLPVAILGALLCLVSMALFLAILIRDALRMRIAVPRDTRPGQARHAQADLPVTARSEGPILRTPQEIQP